MQSNEELMRKLVRTSMIIRHMDGQWDKGPHVHAAHHGKRCEAEGSERKGGPAPHPHGHGHGHGRRHGQARVLTMVSMQEGINQKDLAFLLGIRPQSIGELLHKLEEDGMVERRRSEADGRAIEVYLTPAGRERADQIAKRRKAAAADVLAVLSDEEKEQLSVMLDKIGAELDKGKPERPTD